MSKRTVQSILNVTGSQCKDLRTGVMCSDFLVLVRILAAAFWMSCSCLMALFHCMVRYGSARLGTVRLSSGRFAFPPQFSTAIEWAGLFTRHYNCAASTAVTSS